MVAHDPDETRGDCRGSPSSGRRDRLVRALICRGGGRAGDCAWDRGAAAPLLVGGSTRPHARRTLDAVVGSGLGEDAAYLAATDIARSLLTSRFSDRRRARRFPEPSDFRVADYSNSPPSGSIFDLVVETYTIRSALRLHRPLCYTSVVSSLWAASCLCWPLLA
jgi:hypothetical protein